MDEPGTFKPLMPTGTASIAALLLIVGFIGLVVYQAVRQGEGFRPPVRDFLAFMIVVSFVSTIAYMFVGKVGEGADILIGALIAAFSAIVAVYFRGKGDES
jgi:hypothetical protein